MLFQDHLQTVLQFGLLLALMEELTLNKLVKLLQMMEYFTWLVMKLSLLLKISTLEIGEKTTKFLGMIREMIMLQLLPLLQFIHLHLMNQHQWLLEEWLMQRECIHWLANSIALSSNWSSKIAMEIKSIKFTTIQIHHPSLIKLILH